MVRATGEDDGACTVGHGLGSRDLGSTTPANITSCHVRQANKILQSGYRFPVKGVLEW